MKSDFVAANKQKLDSIRDEFLKTENITGGMVLGIDNTIPRAMFFAQLNVVRDSLQKITKKANTQLKKSKEFLNAPERACNQTSD